MEKDPKDTTQGTPIHGDPCACPFFGNIGPPMIATLQLPRFTIGLLVWLFSTLTILNAPTASHVTTTCHEHQIKVNPLLSSPMKSPPPPSSSYEKSLTIHNHES